MTNKEHNGWYNYETWVVNLWMDNEQGAQTYWAEATNETLAQAAAKPRESFTTEENAALLLADRLKSEHEEKLPELDGFVADLLNAAMSEVNWMEIAKHLIEDSKQNA